MECDLNKFFSVVLFCVLSSSLWADDREAFEKQFDAIQTMKAHFTQTVFSKAKTGNTSSGLMALKKPGQFRWETQEPMEQIVIADGQRLWVYDVLLEQVTVRKQASITDSSAAFFLSTEKGKTMDAYRVSVARKDAGTQYDLFAKSSHADFKHVIFQFRGDQLVALELFDSLGQHTAIKFQAIQTNSKLNSNLFSFHPPKGVDIVDEGGNSRA